MKFSEFVELNPRISLSKDSVFPCVMMDELRPGNKFVTGALLKPYTGGGAKFKQDDTLFARITPCLENGKIAKFRGDKGEYGFGSTEFIVIRAKSGIADPDYVYYLACSDDIRKPAEASMFGASGRQRADISVIQDIEINLPDLPTQRKIAAILSAYDDLIENNTRRIQILEEMAQRIYREWFVHFRFPGHEGVRMVNTELGMVPEGWEVRKVRDIVKRLKAGTKYTKINTEEIGQIPVFDQSTEEFLGFHNNDPDHNATSEHPIIIFGDHTCKMQLLVEPFSVGPNVIPFVASGNLPILFLFFLINSLVETKEYKRHWNDLMGKKVVTPTITVPELFSENVRSNFSLINVLNKRNINLRQTRDLLLPKLISGKIDVSGLDVALGDIPPTPPSKGGIG